MPAPKTDRGGIQQAIRALKAGGWELDFVYDGGDDDEPVTNETEALAAIVAVDDAYLNFKRGDDTGWVRFVLGNDPDEVICDYTTNLVEIDTLTHGWYYDN